MLPLVNHGFDGCSPGQPRISRILERFSQRYSEPIAAVSDVVPTFGGREEGERGGDERGDVIKRAGPGGAEECFQLGEREFDGIEIGTVGRQESESRADAFNGGADFRLLVHRQVVEHDHVAGP